MVSIKMVGSRLRNIFTLFSFHSRYSVRRLNNEINKQQTVMWSNNFI
ncbi:MAG: hypothetical protein JW798_09740 [Prolixibacteraceae bacterium]|nr:hypothetical protein [Prolixibacteraceae bacterium]